MGAMDGQSAEYLQQNEAIVVLIVVAYATRLVVCTGLIMSPS